MKVRIKISIEYQIQEILKDRIGSWNEGIVVMVNEDSQVGRREDESISQG